jgi:hypothetical protein
MSFTRFHDDPCRITKQLQESTGLGRYMLNVPGNGTNPLYMDDPFIRMQKWGGNLMTNTINLESDLFGLSRNSNRDDVAINEYRLNAVKSNKLEYKTQKPYTDQSRATHPAWEYRDLEQTKYNILHLNPQENICFPFQNNLSTRIIEKDIFLAKAPKQLMDD